MTRQLLLRPHSHSFRTFVRLILSLQTDPSESLCIVSAVHVY